MFHATAPALILLLTSLVVAVASMLSWRRRDIPAGRELLWFFGSVLIWSLSAAFEAASSTLAQHIFWSKVEYFGSAAAAPFTLLFCLAFVHRSTWLTIRRQWALWVIPIVIILLAFTNEWHNLVWTSIVPSPTPGSGLYVYSHGPAFWVYIGYSYVYTAAGAVLILRHYSDSGPLYRQQSGAILLSMLAPWVAGILYAFNAVPLPGLDITPVAFAFTALVIAWAIFSAHLLDILPVARSMLLHSMQDGVIVMGARGLVIETNPAMAHLLGHLDLPVGEPAASTFAEWPALVDLLSRRPPVHTEISLAGETRRYFDVRLMSIRDESRGPVGQLAVLRDITPRKQAELALEAKSRQMEQMALTDDLTELYNRRYVHALLRDEFSRAQRYGLTFSVAMLDIDDFKQINDRFGHIVGDEALRCVARVLQTELRLSDVAARIGGDEFMVIFPHTSLKGAYQVMERVRTRICEQVLTPELIHLSCSAGLTARSPDDTQDTLLLRADRLLYDAKGQGRNRVLRSGD